VANIAGSDPSREADREGGTSTSSSLGWLTGVLLLAALVVVVTHLAEERELARLVGQAKPIWLLGALPLQALTYVCAAAVWQRALVHQGEHRKLSGLVPLGLAKLFTDQAVPSAGMSGTLLVVRSLERRGIARAIAVATVLIGLVAFYVAYFLATAAAVAILWLDGELRTTILVPAAVLCLVAVGLPLAILGFRRRTLRRLPRWLERLPAARSVVITLREAPVGGLLRGRLLLETTLLQLGIFLLDALTLGVTLRAVGSAVDAPTVFASFVIASVVATLAWVPGGIGTFEGTSVAMLRLHGIPVEAGLAATLLLRGFTFWLPMLPGLALVRRETRRRPRERAR
jgi:uncharacterized protein (TIRG00374 family)